MTLIGILKRFCPISKSLHYKPYEAFLMKNLLHNRHSSTRIINIEKERETFKDTLPSVINTIKNDVKFEEIPEAGEWMKKILEYNLTGGKYARGITTVLTYKMLQTENKITEDSLKLARTLGWCVEMFQAYCVIVDDIIDNAVTRRGSPCWYRRPEVGLACAINDSIMVNSAIYQVLKTYFSNSPNYIKMVHIMNENLWHTSMGQHLDYKTAQKRKDYSKFTVDRYYKIIKYKSAYYTFNLPISLGLLLAGDVKEDIFRHSLSICLEIGKLFQIQDDFLDCYGNESLTGKASTDIQEGKCTWLAVNALMKCNDAQRVVFKSCYGSPEPAHVERIQRLYKELRLPELYRHEERRIYEDIKELMSALPCEDTRQLFNKILDMQYKRKY